MPSMVQSPAPQAPTNAAPSTPAPLFLSREEVATALGVGKTTVWRLAKAAKEGRGDFPQPVRFGARCTRWRRADVVKWAAGTGTALAGATA